MRGHVREGVKSRLTNRQIYRLLPGACLVAAWRASEKRKVLLEKICGEKKLTIRVVV